MAQLSDLKRRVGVGVIGLAAAATLVAGCSSSGSGKPSTGGGNTSTAAGGSSSTASTPVTGGGSSTSSNGGGGGSVDPAFCTGFNSSDLANLGSTNSEAGVIKAWDQFTKDAPSEIKPNVEDIDKYLHDVADHNFTGLQTEASKLAADSEAIGSYFATHCHS